MKIFRISLNHRKTIVPVLIILSTGHRAIGLLEREDGSYGAHYTKWIPSDPPEVFEARFNEETPLGEVFREEPISEGISIKRGKQIAKEKDADVIIKIDTKYNIKDID